MEALETNPLTVVFDGKAAGSVAIAPDGRLWGVRWAACNGGSLKNKLPIWCFLSFGAVIPKKDNYDVNGFDKASVQGGAVTFSVIKAKNVVAAIVDRPGRPPQVRNGSVHVINDPKHLRERAMSGKSQ